ncbi:helix-turn-helix domain-containing protein [Streptomyces sp. TRM68416]|uniref:helix-turn-helix domain-containing protein n=1 Tax=Streptomyces sp. TRM68416 TaxID=2758412 RepID=UPI001661F963|nr:Scr1 family TA system antitoxin-like transcriptional regulator [Streptomyces sp. TRM68416]MBD0839024.1 helix-turn-helix domain-containing protein [Streptomyces sp. TRM68416]
MTLEPEQLGRSKADLAETLRDLRKRAGLTGDRLAKRCAMSQSKISKIETGKTTPSLVDVERILRAVDAPPELVSEVMALARMANTEWQDKRSSWRRGLEKRQAELAALESESTEMRYFLPSMLTGLLATPEYVRASLTHSPGGKTKTVARKLERQAVLYDTSKRFTFLLTEQAIRWAIVPTTAMAVQIDRLTSLSRLPNIRIGVVPNGTNIPRGPLNTFTIYDDRLATVETFTGRIVFQDGRDIAQYREIFEMYAGFAIYGDGAREFLAACVQSLLHDL